MFNADARPIEQTGITAGKQHIETRIATNERYRDVTTTIIEVLPTPAAFIDLPVSPT